jgi:hypothetical protein
MTQVVVWLNAVANTLGLSLAFVGWLPGWLSLTLIVVVSGVIMLLAFKYTSNQQGIKRARQEIRASLLAVKLFYDSPWVGLRGQAGALVGALKLLYHAIVPILVMMVPMTLMLGQFALWYQARPVAVGEETVITLKLAGDASASWPAVTLDSNDAIEDPVEPTKPIRPVRVYSQRELCWGVRAKKAGLHKLVFHVDGQAIEKEIAIGDGAMVVSQRRPDWDWQDALMHPREAPFAADSLVRSIEVQYPTRSGWITGTDYWIATWFVVSLLAGFLLRGVFKVNL